MAAINEQGSVSIEAQHIMPIIKRWLYSDKDIFLREVVSNGCDAITKYQMKHPGTEEEMSVTVTVDEKAGTITVSDTGIGMTAEEVKRYINQVAFSGAEEFLKNYQGEKENDKGGIIGHFGLGFYSVFMVSDQVTIQTLSCEEGAEPVRWVSADGMSFEMDAGSREAHGTDIILHISGEEKEFLEPWRVREVLKRYCGYMKSPVYLVNANPPAAPEAEEAAEGAEPKEPEAPKPERINDTEPLWLKKPSECTEEEYKTFYHRMFSDFDDPLFWVHLNVDYPFNLKGILYFPKLKEDFGTREGEIKLFSGQVFVADNIKEVIPEFLMLLKGVIDCPDLPLNVSRSFLQNDGYVRKISAHITKKVADRLTGLFNTERETYQGYWRDIAPFVRYGCTRDRKFFEAVKDTLLYETTEGGWLTLAEYRDRNGEKAGDTVYYTNDPKRQAASVAMYTKQGLDVAVMDTVVDLSFMSFMEYSSGEEKAPKFARVDADISGLTEKDAAAEDGPDAEKLQALFRDALGQPELTVKLEALADPELTAMVTADEQGRRFREMSRFYGQGFAMPVQNTLVLNRQNATIKALAARDPADETTGLLCKQIYDLARMAAQPLEAEEITAFLARSAKLLGMVP